MAVVALRLNRLYTASSFRLLLSVKKITEMLAVRTPSMPMTRTTVSAAFVAASAASIPPSGSFDGPFTPQPSTPTVLPPWLALVMVVSGESMQSKMLPLLPMPPVEFRQPEPW